jgi:DNA processing protein
MAKNLIAYLGSAEAVFRETPAALKKIPSVGKVLAEQIAGQQVLQRAEKELQFIEKNKITALFYADKEYPFRLKECDDAPVVLYAKGNIELNANRFVGIVGTRNATVYGKDLCKKFVADLAALQPQTAIVSGLAYGVDICAHKAALESYLPTYAVLGHGLDRIYPAAHRETAVKMLSEGGLLSEYLSETSPDRQNFVQRNRIIAGLCDAVLVVESSQKGGSLITANIAQSYNRDVFAFPGRVGDAHSEGCNSLIKSNKAALIESAADFLDAMGWEAQSSEAAQAIQTNLFAELTEDEQAVVSLLRKGDMQLNELAISLSVPVSRMSSMLLNMEFGGVVKCLPGNLYRLRC